MDPGSEDGRLPSELPLLSRSIRSAQQPTESEDTTTEAVIEDLPTAAALTIPVPSFLSNLFSSTSSSEPRMQSRASYASIRNSPYRYSKPVIQSRGPYLPPQVRASQHFRRNYLNQRPSTERMTDVQSFSPMKKYSSERESEFGDDLLFSNQFQDDDRSFKQPSFDMFQPNDNDVIESSYLKKSPRPELEFILDSDLLGIPPQEYDSKDNNIPSRRYRNHDRVNDYSLDHSQYALRSLPPIRSRELQRYRSRNAPFVKTHRSTNEVSAENDPPFWNGLLEAINPMNLFRSDSVHSEDDEHLYQNARPYPPHIRKPSTRDSSWPASARSSNRAQTLSANIRPSSEVNFWSTNESPRNRENIWPANISPSRRDNNWPTNISPGDRDDNWPTEISPSNRANTWRGNIRPSNMGRVRPSKLRPGYKNADLHPVSLPSSHSDKEVETELISFDSLEPVYAEDSFGGRKIVHNEIPTRPTNRRSQFSPSLSRSNFRESAFERRNERPRPPPLYDPRQRKSHQSNRRSSKDRMEEQFRLQIPPSDIIYENVRSQSRPDPRLEASEYKEDFPLREDLYIGKDGNIYINEESSSDKGSSQVLPDSDSFAGLNMYGMEHPLYHEISQSKTSDIDDETNSIPEFRKTNRISGYTRDHVFESTDSSGTTNKTTAHKRPPTGKPSKTPDIRMGTRPNKTTTKLPATQRKRREKLYTDTSKFRTIDLSD